MNTEGGCTARRVLVRVRAPQSLVLHLQDRIAVDHIQEGLEHGLGRLRLTLALISAPSPDLPGASANAAAFQPNRKTSQEHQ